MLTSTTNMSIRTNPTNMSTNAGIRTSTKPAMSTSTLTRMGIILTAG